MTIPFQLSFVISLLFLWEGMPIHCQKLNFQIFQTKTCPIPRHNPPTPSVSPISESIFACPSPTRHRTHNGSPSCLRIAAKITHRSPFTNVLWKDGEPTLKLTLLKQRNHSPPEIFLISMSSLELDQSQILLLPSTLPQVHLMICLHVVVPVHLESRASQRLTPRITHT
jgi:hypothetical protein